MGDQLSILWNLVQHDSKWIDQALNQASKLQLKSANDLRDLLFSLRAEENNHTAKDSEQNTTTYSHIKASTREIDSYIEIMKGGQLA